MEKRLTRLSAGLRGDVSGLRGDVSGISGDVTGLSGDVTWLRGNVDECGISSEDRMAGIDVLDLVNTPNATK